MTHADCPYPLQIPGTLRGSRPGLREVTQISPKSSKTYDSITSRSSGASPEFFSDIFSISSKSLKKTCHLLKITHQQRPPPNNKHILTSRRLRIPIKARIKQLPLLWHPRATAPPGLPRRRRRQRPCKPAVTQNPGSPPRTTSAASSSSSSRTRPLPPSCAQSGAHTWMSWLRRLRAPLKSTPTSRRFSASTM